MNVQRRSQPQPQKFSLKSIPVSFLISLIMATLLVAVSYFIFQTYQPKNLKQVREVKGYSTDSSLDLPIPFDSEKISKSTTSDTKQLMIKSTRSQEDLQKYFKNVLLAKKWQVDKQTVDEKFIETVYKKDKDRVMVISSTDEEKTILTVEILED